MTYPQNFLIGRKRN